MFPDSGEFISHVHLGKGLMDEVSKDEALSAMYPKVNWMNLLSVTLKADQSDVIAAS